MLSPRKGLVTCSHHSSTARAPLSTRPLLNGFQAARRASSLPGQSVCHSRPFSTTSSQLRTVVRATQLLPPPEFTSSPHSIRQRLFSRLWLVSAFLFTKYLHWFYPRRNDMSIQGSPATSEHQRTAITADGRLATNPEERYFWEGSMSEGSTSSQAPSTSSTATSEGSRKNPVSRFFKKATRKVKAPARAIRELSHSHEESLGLSPNQNEKAFLRRNNTLSPEELVFLDARVKRIAETGDLARFLDLPVGTEVDERDVPVIGLGGSGGGMRANLGFLSTIIAFQEEGLWPLITYAAGVSGSCWALASLYTLPLSVPLTSPLSADPCLEHFKGISGTHPLSTKGVNKVADATNGVQSLFGPLVAKNKVGQEICIIDLYSTLLSSYFWMIKGSDGKHIIDPTSLKWSRAWENGRLEDGMEPFPILTAVRHERPWRDWKSKEEPFEDEDDVAAAEHQNRDAWWTWWEINPIEVGSDELEGWVPTWAFGRHFDKGASTQELPEHSLALFLGLATAAPAAPLSSFLGTLWRNLPRNVFGNATRRMLMSFSRRVGDHGMDRLDNLNPIHSSNNHNPFFGAPKEPGRGNGFENSPRLHLVDAGMSCNVPTHVFLHPGRDVDVVILFDASSDVQKGAAIERINEYGASKGLVFTPRTPFAPLQPLKKDIKGKPIAISPEEMKTKFDGRYAQILDGVAQHVVEGKEGVTYNDKHQPQSWRDVILVYVPLLPNAGNPTYDPSAAAFSSSYNLVWSPDHVDTIQKTSRLNITDALPTIKLAIREAYERRRANRLAAKPNPVEVARTNLKNEALESDLIIKTAAAGRIVDAQVEASGKRPWMEEA